MSNLLELHSERTNADGRPYLKKEEEEKVLKLMRNLNVYLRE